MEINSANQSNIAISQRESSEQVRANSQQQNIEREAEIEERTQESQTRDANQRVGGRIDTYA